MRIVTEREFSERIRELLSAERFLAFGCVTGPARSGAVAAVYASHILRIPFLPYGSEIPEALRPALIIDTARESGETLRKAARKYAYASARAEAVYHEPPRVAFWYESPKPQSYQRDSFTFYASMKLPTDSVPSNLIEAHQQYRHDNLDRQKYEEMMVEAARISIEMLAEPLCPPPPPMAFAAGED